MALTTEQKIKLFVILEVPYKASAYRLIDEDNLTAMERIANNTETQAKSLIENHLATLDSDTETVLSGLINQWISLGTCSTLVEAGGTGSVQGVTYDPERERINIRREVLVIVPFYRAHEELQRRKTDGSVGCITLIR